MLSSNKVKINRELAGKYLRDLRENQPEPTTQKLLADKIGINHYTFISQLERGHATIPPSLWMPLALALGVDPATFCTKMLMWNEPEIYQALFGTAQQADVVELLKTLNS